MRTKEQYIQGLTKMKRNVYFNGARIDRTDELQMDCINTIGTTFDEAAKPENQDLCTPSLISLASALVASITSIRTPMTCIKNRT